MTSSRKTPPPRERKARRKAPVAFAVSVPSPARHPLYGEIPLVEVIETVFDRTFSRWDYDRDYQPPLPKGALRGDPHQQHYCPVCHVPRYFYVDQPRRCVACDADFVFSAREQKHWFETLHFHFDAVPIRCLACRRRLRSGRALYQAVERAKVALRDAPQDPARKIAVAEALVRLKEPTGQGNLDEAIRLARSAARAPGTTAAQRAEAAFWEGKAQAVAGREGRACELLTLALTALPSSKRGIALRSEAKWWLEPRS